MSQENPFKVIQTRQIYQNPWLKLREDSIIQPDGQPGIYGVVEAAKVATGVIALTPQNEIFLVGQYRYPTKQYSWEIIEGGAEVGENPLHAAQRELREEAGLQASDWQQLGGEIHLSNCMTDEVAVLFVAKGLSDVTKNPDPTEVLQIRKISLTQAMAMVDSGEIKDAMSIIALLRFSRDFNKHEINRVTKP